MSTMPNLEIEGPPLSRTTFVIAGIKTIVYGLDELPMRNMPQTSGSTVSDRVSCLWLLHPRGETHEYMEPIANACIKNWNARPDQSHGLIAVSFDQRNHGSREVSARANQSWREGNPTHAQDMFSIYQGTAMDTSLLIDNIDSFVFPHSRTPMKTHLVLGVSLGGHAAWLCLMHEKRITAGVVVIGCPDYLRLMRRRATQSKLQSVTVPGPVADVPPMFFGSSDFPATLVANVVSWDPAARFLHGKLPLDRASGDSTEPLPVLTDEQKPKHRDVLEATLKGKKILCLSGAEDKLVPYQTSAPFISFIEQAVDNDHGWYADGNVQLLNRVFPGVGHEFTADMAGEAVKFVKTVLCSSFEELRSQDSKI